MQGVVLGACVSVSGFILYMYIHSRALGRLTLRPMTPRQATEGIAADMVLRVVCRESEREVLRCRSSSCSGQGYMHVQVPH